MKSTLRENNCGSCGKSWECTTPSICGVCHYCGSDKKSEGVTKLALRLRESMDRNTKPNKINMEKEENMTVGAWVIVIVSGLFIFLIVLPIFILVMLLVVSGIKSTWQENFTPPPATSGPILYQHVDLDRVIDNAKKRSEAAETYCKKHGYNAGIHLDVVATSSIAVYCGYTIPDPVLESDKK